MGERLRALAKHSKEYFLEVFPLPIGGTAAAFAEFRLKDPRAVANIEMAEDAIATSKDEVASYIAEYARRMLEQEDQRQASVIGRAQSLFFAVALLSSFLSVGAGFLVSARAPHAGEILVVSIFAVFLVAQVILLVLSLTRAIGGLDYRRAGASDFARWAGYNKLGALHRNEAVCTLDWYRTSALINSWRFGCLSRALMALRNVVIGSGVLVVVVLAFANFPPHPICTDRSEFRADMVTSYSVECPIERPRHE